MTSLDMGIIYHTYPLDRKHAEELLSSLPRHNGPQLSPKLLSMARRAAQTPNPAAAEFLEDIGFHFGWFDTSDPEIDNIEDWLKVALSPALRSMGDLPYLSLAVLERLLPAIGWTAEETQWLLKGRAFSTLVMSLGLQELLPHIFRPPNVGWLAANDVVRFRRTLAENSQIISHPSGVELSLVYDALGPGFPNDKSPGNLLKEAFTHACHRLDHSITLGCELLFYNDR